MGIESGQIIEGTVMHARQTPARNAFKYRMYYVSLPLSRLDECDIPQDRFAATSFWARDHGPCDGSPLAPWAQEILARHGIYCAGAITLVCMPRILGYVFNPVSFWVCRDEAGDVVAVICEVHNTFGERHAYICAREDRGPIRDTDCLTAHKIFHVSPFLERDGRYTFRFDIQESRFGVRIDYFDETGNLVLATSLAGRSVPLSRAALREMFWSHPLVTFKAIALIHWQALKLLAMGIRHVRKPAQKDIRISATGNMTKI